MKIIKNICLGIICILCSGIAFADTAADVDIKTTTPVETEKVLNTADSVQKAIDINGSSVFETNHDDSELVQGGVQTNKIISIDDCIRLALEHNPAIKEALYSSEAQKTKIVQAWANFFPVLGASLGYSRNDMLVTNYRVPQQQYNLFQAPHLSAEMKVFDFGKTNVEAKIAKLGHKASEKNVQTNINDVIFSVKESYYKLLYAFQKEQVYADTVANYELHLKQAQAYYEIGEKAKIDVVTAQYNLGNSKLSLIKAKNNISLSYANLNNSMGLPEYAHYSVDEKFSSKLYDVKFEDVIKSAYEVRPELLAAKDNYDAAKLLVKGTKCAFLPDVKLQANFTSGGKNFADDYGYQLGGAISYTQVNLLKLKKQMDEAKANLLATEAAYNKIKQNVYLEVESAYIRLKEAQESVPVAKLSLIAAREQYDLASGRYKVGLGDAVELKDAENTYIQAQLNFYETILNYNIAAASLERVVGVPLKPTDIPLI